MGLLQMSACGGLLVLAAALVRALAGRRVPRGTFLFLWWTATARLLLPVTLPSRLSIYSLLQTLGQISKAPVPTPAAPVTAGTPVMILPPVLPTEAVPAPAPFPVKTAVWLAVAALLALWFLASYIRWGRRFRESLPVACAYAARWQAERPRIQVRVSDRIAAPLACGLLHPVILLPKGMDWTDEDALQCILTHEETHIRRLDGLLKLALAAALYVHWFNPAVWLMYVLANRDMELRCDEVVLGKLGSGNRELYALTLIRMAENGHMPLCGFSRKSGMEERITAIMKFQKKSTFAWALALLLAACITTVFATTAWTGGDGAGPGSAGTQDSDEALEDAGAQILADLSKEIESQWKEVLEPYVPFGLTYVYAFDGPDDFGSNLKMWFEGREVRGIYDEHTGVWITGHTGNSTYSEDAVELYAVYDENGLAGLRFATEEEQAQFTEDREKSSDEGALEQLRESVRFDNDVCYFTIPQREGRWNIWISGRVLAADGVGMSVHYLEEESEKGEWEPGKTYSFTETSRKVDELIMEASLNDAKAAFDLIADISNLDKDFGAETPAMLPASKGSEGNADVANGLEMVWPVDGGEITKSFGGQTNPGGTGSANHNGVDTGGLERGAPVYAAMAGTVTDTGFDSQAGNYVRIDHGSDMETYYAHCQSVQVKTGDAVDVGQTIATVGSTGASTGPHLHFEILVDGEPQDPAAYYPIAYASREAGTVASWAAQAAARKPLSPEAKEDLEKRLILWAEETLADGEYPRNKNGQTYAPNQGLASLVGAPPDLIGARATNGTYGYVPLAELPIHGRILWGTLTRISDTEAKESRSLPVYDKDGEVIGEFVVEAGA